MLAFIAALGIRYWASSKTLQYLGPTHIASNGIVLFVHLNGDLIKLNGQGKMLDRYTQQQTGFDRPPIDLRVLSDGRLLYAEHQPARIRLCNTNTWHCEELGKGLVNKFRREYKVWVDEPNAQLIFTDAAGGGVWAQPLQGGDASALMAPTSCVANDLAVTEQGRIWVADSGNYRLIELAQSTNDALAPIDESMPQREISREISTKHDLVRGNRNFPMMLAQDPKGNWWVTQPTATAGPHADILLYDPDEGVKSRIDLPQEVFAFDIAAMGNHMIISELDGYRLHSINTETFAISEFGDEQFKTLMQETQQRYSDFNNTSNHAMVAMLVFGSLMIIAAFVATPKHKRWTKRAKPVNLQPSDALMPPIQGTYWLKRNPATDRFLKYGEPVFYILIALVAIMLISVVIPIETLGDKTDDPKAQQSLQLLSQMVLFLAIVIALLPIMGRIGFNAAKRLLGTDGNCLFIKLHDGQQLRVDPKELAYTKATLFYRHYVLPLQNGYYRPFYAPGELQSYLFPLLSQASKLNPWQVLKHLWIYRSAATAFHFIYFTALFVVLFWFSLRIEAL